MRIARVSVHEVTAYIPIHLLRIARVPIHEVAASISPPIHLFELYPLRIARVSVHEVTAYVVVKHASAELLRDMHAHDHIKRIATIGGQIAGEFYIAIGKDHIGNIPHYSTMRRLDGIYSHWWHFEAFNSAETTIPTIRLSIEQCLYLPDVPVVIRIGSIHTENVCLRYRGRIQGGRKLDLKAYRITRHCLCRGLSSVPWFDGEAVEEPLRWRATRAPLEADYC